MKRAETQAQRTVSLNGERMLKYCLGTTKPAMRSWNAKETYRFIKLQGVCVNCEKLCAQWSDENGVCIVHCTSTTDIIWSKVCGAFTTAIFILFNFHLSWAGAWVKLGKMVKWVYGRKSTRRHRTGVVFLVDFSPELFVDVELM